MRREGVLLVAAALALAAPVRACPGDCSGDGTVGIEELVRAVNVALGLAAPTLCPAADANGDGTVAINELIAATAALLDGCPPGATPTPTAPPTETPTDTPTASPTVTPTVTATVNQPVVLATPFVYRGIAGEPIARPLGAVDPDGGAAHCTAAELPAGMALVDDVLHWTPADGQVGLLSVPLECRDDAEPPATSTLALDFRIAPRAACAVPVCDPAQGCTTALPVLDPPCCDDVSRSRVPELVRTCPPDRVLQIGQSVAGFGRVHDCDWMRFRTASQSSATLQFHLRVSCINVFVRSRLHVRLEHALRGVLIDYTAMVSIPTTLTDGFYELRRVTVPFAVDGPYFNIEDTEANLTVSLEDSTGAQVSESVRVRLTSDTLPDLPD